MLTVARAAVQVGVRVLISLEKTKIAKFTLDDLKKHELYQKIKEEDKSGLFSVLEATWISFNPTHIYKYDEQAFLDKRKGCDSLYGTLAINPKKEVLSCCGLTVQYMPEMTLGKLGEKPLREIYDTQLHDFIKQWIYAEGPMAILEQVECWNRAIKLLRFVHPFQACAFIYQTSEIVEIIQNNYLSVVKNISEKFYQKLLFNDIFEKKLEQESLSNI